MPLGHPSVLYDGYVEQVCNNWVGFLAFFKVNAQVVSVEILEFVEEVFEEVKVVVDDQQSELVASDLLDEAVELYVVDEVYASIYADVTLLAHYSCEVTERRQSCWGIDSLHLQSLRTFGKLGCNGFEIFISWFEV